MDYNRRTFLMLSGALAGPGDLPNHANLRAAASASEQFARTLLFTEIAEAVIPNDTTLLETAGFAVLGQGIATYRFDPKVDAAYVRRNPLIAALSTNGRGFVLVAHDGVSVTQTGAIGDGRADDSAAIQAALTAHHRVYFPAGRYKITSTLLFDRNHHIEGSSKGGLSGQVRIEVSGAIAGFRGRNHTTVANNQPAFRNLTINNAASAAPGMIGIDLFNASHAVVENCAFRNHDRAISMETGNLGGYYHAFLNNEYASCNFAIHGDPGLRGGGNGMRVIGGRIFSCQTGIYAHSILGCDISLSIENCAVGVHFAGFAGSNRVFCYFEGNGDQPVGSARITSRLGAAVLLEENTKYNRVGGLFSNGTDRIINLNPLNSIESVGAGYGGAHFFGSHNVFWNESLEIDTNADGLSDGLALNAALPSGMTLSSTTTPGEFATGTKAQKMVLAAAGTSVRHLNVVPFATTPGHSYAFRIRCKTNLSGAWNLRGSSDSYSGAELLNAPLVTTDVWSEIGTAFVATSTEAYFYFWMSPAAAGPKRIDAILLLDSIWFGPGSVAPAFGDQTPKQTFPTFANNIAATAAGLAIGTVYKTATGKLRIVI